MRLASILLAPVLLVGCLGVTESTRRPANYINGGLMIAGGIGIVSSASINGSDPLIDRWDVRATSLGMLVLGMAGIVGTVAINWAIDTSLNSGSTPP